jgi:hypothetical protein
MDSSQSPSGRCSHGTEQFVRDHGRHVVALVEIVVVFLLVSGVFAPQNGGINIHL